MMKILIVIPKYNADGEENRHYTLPMGILYVSSFLKQKRFDVDCLNLNHYRSGKLRQVLASKRFDVVCTGGISIQFRPIKNVIDEVKNYDKKVITIVGGGIATAHPEFVLKALNADYLVLGEGEVTAATLLKSIESGDKLDMVPGTASYNNGHLMINKPHLRQIENLDKLPFPDYEGFEIGYYIDNCIEDINARNISVRPENPRPGCIVGSRDCPYRCTFCFRIMGGEYRKRCIDNIMSEIEYLINNYGINELFMYDELLSASKKRIFEFCERVKPLRLSWRCQLRVNGINEELLKRMKEAGCYQISYGLESASQTVLKSMKKRTTVKEIENALILTRKAKITIQGNFIFGDPAETDETARETLDFHRRLKLFAINLGLVRPYPGSDLYFNLLKKGVIKDLGHFHETGNGDNGRPINMTEMSDIRFEQLILRLTIEALKHQCFGKVLLREKLCKGKYKISVICPICHKVNSELDVTIGRRECGHYYLRNKLIACRHCNQRFYINKIDLRDNRLPLEKHVRKSIIMMYLVIGDVITRNTVTSRCLFKGYQLAKCARRKYLKSRISRA